MLDEPQNSSMNFDPTKMKLLSKVRGKGKAERQKARLGPALCYTSLRKNVVDIKKGS